MEKISKALRLCLVSIIRLYQRFLSPLLGSHCRFQPTCSQYGIMAIEEYGIIKGIGLTLRRISKCHPLNQGGYDPIPRKTKKN